MKKIISVFAIIIAFVISLFSVGCDKAVECNIMEEAKNSIKAYYDLHTSDYDKMEDITFSGYYQREETLSEEVEYKKSATDTQTTKEILKRFEKDKVEQIVSVKRVNGELFVYIEYTSNYAYSDFEQNEDLTLTQEQESGNYKLSYLFAVKDNEYFVVKTEQEDEISQSEYWVFADKQEYVVAVSSLLAKINEAVTISAAYQFRETEGVLIANVGKATKKEGVATIIGNTHRIRFGDSVDDYKYEESDIEFDWSYGESGPLSGIYKILDTRTYKDGSIETEEKQDFYDVKYSADIEVGQEPFKNAENVQINYEDIDIEEFSYVRDASK